MPLYEGDCRSGCGKFEWYTPCPTLDDKPCPKCGGETDRLYSVAVMHNFESFETTNIVGEECVPIKVTSKSQLRQLEATHGVKLMDADMKPPQTKFDQYE